MAEAVRAEFAFDEASLSNAEEAAALVAHPILGLARFARLAFQGVDADPLIADLEARIGRDDSDAGALMDLSILMQLKGARERGLELQGQALDQCRLYRLLSEPGEAALAPIRLLVLMSPGDFLANTPIDFLIERRNVTLDLLFIRPGEALPPVIPDHDLLMVGVGYNEENAPLLAMLAAALEGWPRPVVNRAEGILLTSREGVAARLGDVHGILVPAVEKIDRATAAELAQGTRFLAEAFPHLRFPLIIRPLGSHAGQGLEKIEDAAALETYLDMHADEAFHIAQFIDYRNDDGFFRKYRIVLFGGRAYLAHLAVSERWMIHYLNAGMLENAQKRAIEAEAMANFDERFAKRHAAAFGEISRRLGLDYVLIDCSQAPDGSLLIFEADNAMVIHDMDDPEIYPYKAPQMARVFSAFRDYLDERNGSGALADV